MTHEEKNKQFLLRIIFVETAKAAT